MVNLNDTIGTRNLLQEAFLNRILQQLDIDSKIYSSLFTLRYHPKNQAAKLGEIATLIKGDKINFEEDSINTYAARVNDKILKVFKTEMEQDEIDVNSILNNPRGNRIFPYELTYQWLWKKKFSRMGWELAKEIASPAVEELDMINIETTKGMILKKDTFFPDYNNCIELENHYRLLINLPISNKYLLLINESVEGKKYLLSPSKGFANIPHTILSEGLYLPPDDQKKGRAKSLQYGTEGEEYFGVIVTEQPIDLSWVNSESDPIDLILNQQRLEEIFIKVGQQSNSEVFYKRFKVVRK